MQFCCHRVTTQAGLVTHHLSDETRPINQRPSHRFRIPYLGKREKGRDPSREEKRGNVDSFFSSHSKVDGMTVSIVQ
jgi:hypothetical protein